jgi:hypothetical protein
MADGSPSTGRRARVLRLQPLKAVPGAADRATVTTPPCSSSGPLAPLRAVLAWVTSPASLPWRGDLARAVLAPAVVLLAVLTPQGTVPLTAAALVAGAYLLLVLAAALGRLDDGVRVPPGPLLGLDALHLFWGAHLTSGLGGPVPVVAATAGVLVLLRIALLPPVPAGRAAPLGLPHDPASAAAAAAHRCPACPHGSASWDHGPQREGLELARAEA